MDEDKFGLVEKILKTIDNIIKTNMELNSFEIIPVDINYSNKSPLVHIANHLGMESWAVKHVYMYCYTTLMDKYFAKPNRKATRANASNHETIKKLLNAALLLNPEVVTFWNKRRELVTQGYLNVECEMRFTRLVLSRKPKSSETFSYRKWLLLRILRDVTESDQMTQIVTEELKVSESASMAASNNYHSWTHRVWFVQQLCHLAPLVNLDLLFIQEYNFSKQWISYYVSDFSGFHYRQYCISKVMMLGNEIYYEKLEEKHKINFKQIIRNLVKAAGTGTVLEADKCDEFELVQSLMQCPRHNKSIKDYRAVYKCLCLMLHELIYNDDLLKFFDSHECLWYHRRFVINFILNLLNSNNCDDKIKYSSCGDQSDCEADPEKRLKMDTCDKLCSQSTLLGKLLAHKEIKNLADRSQDPSAKKYERWFKEYNKLHNPPPTNFN